MTDILEQMKGALIRFDGLFLSRDGAADAMPFLGADALYLFPEAIKEIEEMRKERDAWRKVMQSMTPQGSEYSTPEACAAFVAMEREDRHNARVDRVKANRRAEAAEAKLAKAVEVIQDAYFEGYNSAQKIHDPFSPAYAWEKSKARAEAAEIGGEKP